MVRLDDKHVEDIKKAFEAGPGYFQWDNEKTFIENILSYPGYIDDYICDNYTTIWDYDYSISDSYCEHCDGY